MNLKSKPVKPSSRVGYPSHVLPSKITPHKLANASKTKAPPVVSYRPSATPDPVKRTLVFKEKAPNDTKQPKGLLQEKGENHLGLNAQTPDKIDARRRQNSLLKAAPCRLPPTQREERQAKQLQPAESLSGFKSMQKNCFMKSDISKDSDLPARSQGIIQRKSGPDFRAKDKFRKSSAHDIPCQPPKALDQLPANKPLFCSKAKSFTRPISAQRQIPTAYLNNRQSHHNSQLPKSSKATSNKPTPTTQVSTYTSANAAVSQNDALKVFVLPILRSLDEKQLPSMPAHLPSGSLALARDKASRLSQFNQMAKCLCGLKVGERTWFLAVNLFELATLQSEKFVSDWEASALACFLVASKFESVRSPDAYDIVHCSGSEVKPRSVFAFESLILHHFDFSIVMTLTYDYYVMLSSIVLAQTKARNIGLFMLMIFHCSQTTYQTDKALIAFSLCLFLAQRFREPIFWSRYYQGESEFYGFKLYKNTLELSEDSDFNYDYSFEVEKVDRTCERITEACLGCKVEEHSWIFSLFAGDKYMCGQK